MLHTDLTTEHPVFELGRVMITPGATEYLQLHGGVESLGDKLLARHLACDFGAVTPSEAEGYRRAAIEGGLVLSAYTVAGKKVFIATEADRSYTTIMLGEEY